MSNRSTYATLLPVTSLALLLAMVSAPVRRSPITRLLPLRMRLCPHSSPRLARATQRHCASCSDPARRRSCRPAIRWPMRRRARGFVAMYDAKHAIAPESEDKVWLQIGEDGWPPPVPLVRRDGRWYFDGAEGADEIVYRRVGANELGAIAVCRGYVAAKSNSRHGTATARVRASTRTSWSARPRYAKRPVLGNGRRRGAESGRTVHRCRGGRGLPGQRRRPTMAIDIARYSGRATMPTAAHWNTSTAACSRTAPSYHRQVVVMTSPARRQHRHQRRGPGVAPDLGERVRRPRPRAGPVQLALGPLARRRAARAGRGRHQRHRHPRADPAPPRARRHAGRHLLDRPPTRTRCWPGSGSPPR